MAKIEIFMPQPVQKKGRPVMGSLEYLRPGDRVEALVLKIIDRHDILLEFANRPLRARVDFAVRQGQMLHLEVEKATRPLLVRVIDKPGLPGPGLTVSGVMEDSPAESKTMAAMVESLGQLLGTGKEKVLGQEVFRALRQVMEALSPLKIDSNFRQLAACLKQRIEGGGHFFEHNLARILATIDMPGSSLGKQEPAGLLKDILAGDLKPGLAIVSRWIESQAAGQVLDRQKIADLRGLIALASKQVEARQHRLVRQGKEQPEGAVLYFQFPVAGWSKPLRLSAYYPKSRKFGGQKGARIALLLEMDNLGPVRADLSLENGILDVEVCVAGPAADFVISHLSALEQSLGEYFQRVQCRVISDSVKVESFKRHFDLASDRRIDINI